MIGIFEAKILLTFVKLFESMINVFEVLLMRLLEVFSILLMSIFEVSDMFVVILE
jgi:hypothetical protein